MVNRGLTPSRKVQRYHEPAYGGRRIRRTVYWSLPREIVMVDSVLVRTQRMSSRR
jgi:hypothetical protein